MAILFLINIRLLIAKPKINFKPSTNKQKYDWPIKTLDVNKQIEKN